MDLAAGQAEQQEAVDRAEAQLAPLGALAGAGQVVEQPAQLGRGEVGIDQQAGALGHQWFGAVAVETAADFRRAPVLPDDGVVQRLSRAAVPQGGGFALVGDADGGDGGGGQAGVLEGCPADDCCVAPDVLQVVLDPAVMG